MSEATDWFVFGGTKKIDLPGDQWIEMKEELTFAESERLKGAALRVREGKDGKAEMQVDSERYELLRIVMWTKRWSLVDGQHRPVPINFQTVAALRPAAAKLIVSAIDAHVTAKDEEEQARQRRLRGEPEVPEDEEGIVSVEDDPIEYPVASTSP